MDLSGPGIDVKLKEKKDGLGGGPYFFPCDSFF
jgi:hypothetical protein